jgi:hypothetical protein
MRTLIFALTLLLSMYAASAIELEFNRPVVFPDGTEIVSRISIIREESALAKYRTYLQKNYEKADPRLIRPQIPNELSEIAVIQDPNGSKIKLWTYILPGIMKQSDRESEMLPRPRALFSIPDTDRFLLIWQVSRKLMARELKKGVENDAQTLPAGELALLRSFDALNSIGSLKVSKTGELHISIVVDGKSIALRRLDATWEPVIQ